MKAWYTEPYARLEYKVRFLTPAFLGDAEQDGAWRTPAFKALINFTCENQK